MITASEIDKEAEEILAETQGAVVEETTTETTVEETAPKVVDETTEDKTPADEAIEEAKQEEKAKEETVETDAEKKKNPFLETEEEEKSSVNVESIIAEKNELQEKYDSLLEIVNNDGVRFLLDAMEKGKNPFDALKEIAPLDVDRIPYEELLEIRIDRIKESKRLSKDEVEAERERYENMNARDREELLEIERDRIRKEQDSKPKEFEFKVEDKINKEKEFKAKLKQLEESSLKELENEVERLIKGEYITPEQKKEFYTELDNVPPLYFVSDGIATPNQKVAAELVYLRKFYTNSVEKAVSEAETEVRIQEANKRKNNNTDKNPQTITPPSESREDLIEWAIKQPN